MDDLEQLKKSLENYNKPKEVPKEVPKKKRVRRTKEDIERYRKKYYTENQIILRQNAKVYRQLNKTKIKKDNDTYREKYPDKITEYNRIYRTIHKDEMKKKAKEPYFCETCNKTIARASKYTHFRSNNHLAYLAKSLNPS